MNTNLVKCYSCAHTLSNYSEVITCVLCKSTHMHLSHFGPTSCKPQWFCTVCISNLFPYNHISDDTGFAQCINETNKVSLSLNELRKGPRQTYLTNWKLIDRC